MPDLCGLAKVFFRVLEITHYRPKVAVCHVHLGEPRLITALVREALGVSEVLLCLRNWPIISAVTKPSLILS